MDQATLTITLIPTAVDSVGTRSLVLGPPKYHAIVGRSSKVQSKNIFPAADNGWFDNRVMSRNHAEFSALPKFQEVYIIDTDSMHGTWVNGNKLTSGRQTLLEQGDVLTFGAEVSRASESYKPVEVRLRLTWTTENVPAEPPAKPRVAVNSFVVPDDDDDEEEDLEEEDDDVVEVPSPEKATPRSAPCVVTVDTDDEEEPSYEPKEPEPVVANHEPERVEVVGRIDLEDTQTKDKQTEDKAVEKEDAAPERDISPDAESDESPDPSFRDSASEPSSESESEDEDESEAEDKAGSISEPENEEPRQPASPVKPSYASAFKPSYYATPMSDPYMYAHLTFPESVPLGTSQQQQKAPEKAPEMFYPPATSQHQQKAPEKAQDPSAMYMTTPYTFQNQQKAPEKAPDHSGMYFPTGTSQQQQKAPEKAQEHNGMFYPPGTFQQQKAPEKAQDHTQGTNLATGEGASNKQARDGPFTRYYRADGRSAYRSRLLEAHSDQMYKHVAPPTWDYQSAYRHPASQGQSRYMDGPFSNLYGSSNIYGSAVPPPPPPPPPAPPVTMQLNSNSPDSRVLGKVTLDTPPFCPSPAGGYAGSRNDWLQSRLDNLLDSMADKPAPSAQAKPAALSVSRSDLRTIVQEPGDGALKRKRDETDDEPATATTPAPKLGDLEKPHLIDLTDLSDFDADADPDNQPPPLEQWTSIGKPIQLTEFQIQSLISPPSDGPEEPATRPKKRVKTTHRSSNVARYAATAVVGAVLGGVGTVMALAALPTGFFE